MTPEFVPMSVFNSSPLSSHKLRKHAWTMPTAPRAAPPPSLAPPSTAYPPATLTATTKHHRTRGFQMRPEGAARDDLRALRQRRMSSPSTNAAAPSAAIVAEWKRRATPTPQQVTTTDNDGGGRRRRFRHSPGPVSLTPLPSLGHRGVTIPRAVVRTSLQRTGLDAPPPGSYDTTDPIRHGGGIAFSKEPRFFSLSTTAAAASHHHSQQQQQRGRVGDGAVAATTPDPLPGPGHYHVASGARQSSCRGVTISPCNPRWDTKTPIAPSPGPGDYDTGLEASSAAWRRGPPPAGKAEELSMPAAVFLAARIAHDPSLRDPAFLADLRHIGETAQFIGRHQLLRHLA